jgi:hypothetical protein
MSSLKLQPYLELCRFILALLKTKVARWKVLVQTLLKTKVARWKVPFLIGISKRPPVHHSSKRMAYYSRYATGKMSVALGVSLL